jgi:hypothetical protein
MPVEARRGVYTASVGGAGRSSPLAPIGAGTRPPLWPRGSAVEATECGSERSNVARTVAEGAVIGDDHVLDERGRSALPTRSAACC